MSGAMSIAITDTPTWSQIQVYYRPTSAAIHDNSIYHANHANIMFSKEILSMYSEESHVHNLKL